MRMRSLLWVATAAAAANTTLPRRLARSSHHGEVLAASLHAKHADADEIAARYSLLSGPRQKALDTCARGRKAARDAMVEIARTYGSETKEYKELWEAARKSVVQIDAASARVLRAKLVLAVAREGAFEVVIGGHSAAAGHGNWANESYTNVLARALKAPFAAAGVKAIGRNHAMGGTTALPFGWCAETMLGSHPDVVGWDYNMMEGGRWAVSEAYARRALALPSRPLALWVAGPGDPRFTMLNHYRDHGFGYVAVSPEATKWAGIKALRDSAAGVPHALKWIKWNGPAEDKWKKFDSPEAAPGRVKWHPGWRVHQLMGLALAAALLDQLEIALGELAASLGGGGGMTPAAAIERAERDAYPPRVPSPIGKKDGCGHTQGLFCTKATDSAEHKAAKHDAHGHGARAAAAAASPRAAESAVAAAAAGGGFSPDAQAAAAPESDDPPLSCATTYEPKIAPDLSVIARSASPGAWKRVLAPGEGNNQNKNEQYKLGYLDKKFCLEGRKDSGALAVALTAARDGTLVLCEATTGWRRPADMADPADGLSVRVAPAGADGRADGPAKDVKLKQHKDLKQCYAGRFDATAARGASGRDFELEVSVLPADKFICLAHVIWG